MVAGPECRGSGGHESDKSSILWMIIGKITHPLVEVRKRALDSLIFKLDHGLIQAADLAQNDAILRNLIEWFNLPGCSDEEAVISLLQRLARHQAAAIALVNLGGEGFFRDMRGACRQELRPAIDRLLSTLLELPAGEAAPDAGAVARFAPRDGPSSGFDAPGGSYAQYANALARTAANKAALDDPRVARALERIGETEKVQTALDAAHKTVELGGLALRKLPMGVGDDQWLFDINVKLQFSEEPRTLQEALRELSDMAAEDLPVHGILQRQGLLDNILALLHTTDDSPVQDAALRAVHAVVRSIRVALAAASDPDLSAPRAPSPRADAAAAEEGDEGWLLRSYPHPGRGEGLVGDPKGTKPAKGHDDTPGEDEVIRVAPAAHLIAVNLLSLLSTARLHPEALPPALDCIALLAPPAGPLGPQADARFHQYFATLNDALRFLMPAPQDGGSEPAPLTPAGLNVLHVAARLLTLLPEGAAAGAVPPGLASRLGTAAVDHLEAACAPEVRALVLPHLASLSPRLAACHAAEERARRALQAAESIGPEPSAAAAMAGPRRAATVDAIRAAAPALAFTGDAGAAGKFVRLLCVRPEPEGAAGHEWAADSADALLVLLRMEDEKVRSSAYAALAGQLACGRPEGGLALLLEWGVLEEVSTRGLWGEGCCTESLVLLLAAMEAGGEEAAAAVSAWAPWIECRQFDSDLGALARGVCSRLAERRQEGGSAAEAAWASLAPVLRAMFLEDSARRRAAAQLVLGALTPGLASAVGSATSRGATARGARTEARYVDPLGSAAEAWGGRAWAPGARQIGAVEPGGVESLVAMLESPSLGGAIQRSAAEQLGALLEDPRLTHALGDARLLSLVVSRLRGAALDALTHMAADSGGLDPPPDPPGAGGDPRGDFDCGEMVATSCLHILAVAAARSPAARRWLLADPSSRVQALLPLAFHPSDHVRRLLGVTLAFLAFDSARFDPQGRADELCLPPVFLGQYSVPCKTSPAPIDAPGRAPTSERPSADLRARVSCMLAQRRLLDSVGGPEGLDHVLRQLSDDPEGTGLPLDSRHRLAAALQCARLPGSIADGLDRVAASRSHAECAGSIRALRARAAGSGAAAQALASSPGWPRALHRLLSAAPATRADRRLWMDLLALLRCMLASRGVSAPGLLVAARAFKEAAAPVLKEGLVPGVAKAPAGVLLANNLAENSEVEDAIAESERVALCAEVLGLLCDTLRCALSRADAAGLGRVLSLLGAGDLAGTLVARLVAQPGADYGCRVRALRALRLLAAAAGDTWRLRGAWCRGEDALEPSLQEGGSGWDDALARTVEPVIRHVAMTRFGASGSAPQAGWRGKGLLREGLGALQALTDALPAWAWEPQYLAAGGTYWLTCLMRDREASIRAGATSLLASLVSPAAPAARAHVLGQWPEAGSLMVRCAGQRFECPAARAASLRFLVAAMADPESLGDSEEREGVPASAQDFGAETLLRRVDLWEGLPSIATEAGATPALRHGVAGLLLQGALADAVGVSARLRGLDSGWDKVLSLLAVPEVGPLGEDTTFGGPKVTARTAEGERAGTACSAAACVAELVAVVAQHVPEERIRLLRTSPAVRLLSHSVCAAGPGAGAPVPAPPVAPWAPRAARARAHLVVRAAGALGALLRRAAPGPDAAFDDLDPVDPSMATCASACAAVLRPGSPAPLDVKLSTCQLVSTLTASRALACQFLGSEVDLEDDDRDGEGGEGKEAGEEEAPAGHRLCHGAASLFFELHGAAPAGTPAGAQAPPPHSASGWEEVASRRATAGAALGNVLAFSAGAKQCFLRLGAHTRLLAAGRDAHALLSGLAAEAARAPPTVRGAHPPAPPPAGRRELLLQEVGQCLSLLKHLLHGSPGGAAARRAVAAAGGVRYLGWLWPLGRQEPAVLHELLGCLSNLLASSPSAKRHLLRDAADTGSGEAGGVPPPGGANRSLLARVVRLALDPASDATIYQLALGALQSVATSSDTLPVLLKGPLVPGVVSGLRDTLTARRRDRDCAARQAAALRLLTSVASSGPGQKHLLKSTQIPGALDIVLDIVDQGRGPAEEGVFLLRNLSFSPEAKSHFLSNPRVVPALLAAAEGAAAGGAAARRAGLATSALWALVYNGQKVKASLRAAGAPGRLRGCEDLVVRRQAEIASRPVGAPAPEAGEEGALGHAAHNLRVLADLLAPEDGGAASHTSPNTTLADIQDDY